MIQEQTEKAKDWFGNRGAKARLKRILSLSGPLVGLLLVILFFSLFSDTFATLGNFRTVLLQTVIVAMAAMGMTMIIISGGIDLSVGSVIALSTVVIALALIHGAPPLLAALMGIASGALCGWVNGTIITRFRIVPFIVTLGSLLIVRGIAKHLADNQKIDAPITWLQGIMYRRPTPSWILIPPGVWILVGAAIAVAIVLRYTLLGRFASAIGSNEATARLCGIRVNRTKVMVYTLGGIFTGLAGLMQFSRLTVGDPTVAVGLELEVIAAVVIGGGSLSGGEGSVFGSLIGAFLISFIRNGCSQMGFPTYFQEIVTGMIIITAAGIDQLRHRRSP